MIKLGKLLSLFLLPVTAFGTITGTDRGTGGTNASSATLVIAPATTMAAGSMGVLCYSGDNAAGNAANTPSSMTDSVGNVWVRRNWGFSGAANTTAEIVAYTSQLTTNFTSSDTLTMTFTTANVVAKCYTLSELAPASGSIVVFGDTNKSNASATGTPSITTNRATSVGGVMMAMGAAESGDTWTGDSDTSNGSWSTKQSLGEGSGATGASVISQYKVLTANGNQTYNPTLTSADSELLWMTLHEAPANTRALGGNAGSESTTTVTVGYTIAAGSMGVLCLSADNAGANGSAANIPTSLTDSKSNTWTLQSTTVYDNGAASAGAEVGIYTSVLSTPLVNLDTIPIVYQAVNVVAKVYAVFEFSTATSYVTGDTATGTTGTPSKTTTASVSNGNIVVGALSAEGGDTSTADSDTSNGSWSSMAHAACAGTAVSDISLSAQYKTVTATGAQTYNPTLTSADTALAIGVLAAPAASSNKRYLHFLDFFR